MIFFKERRFFATRKFIRLFFLLCAFLGCTSFVGPDEIPEKPMVVLITSYNNSRWLNKNLISVLKQNYSNYRIIYIDDCSQDGTGKLAHDLIHTLKQESKITLICNKERKGALANIYDAVWSCSNEEIIVSLDGDDWFPDVSVLKKINAEYTKSEIWLTHGTLIEYPNKSTSWCIPVPENIIKQNLFRTYRCPSHLRTFYAWLFKMIDVDDLLHEGQFFSMTWDQAIMFPMIEMAGERHSFIKDTVYVYNVANSINDNKVNAGLQNQLEAIIRAKKPYSRLEKSPLD